MRLDDLKFDFMSYRKIAAVVSATLVVLSFLNLAINEVEWGLDFTGGTLVEVFYEQSVDPEQIRIDLDSAGYEGLSAESRIDCHDEHLVQVREDFFDG